MPSLQQASVGPQGSGAHKITSIVLRRSWRPLCLTKGELTSNCGTA